MVVPSTSFLLSEQYSNAFLTSSMEANGEGIEVIGILAEPPEGSSILFIAMLSYFVE